MTNQEVKTIWIYGPDNAGKSAYTNRVLSSMGYQFFEILLVSNDDFRELASIDNKKKVLFIENVRHD